MGYGLIPKIQTWHKTLVTRFFSSAPNFLHQHGVLSRGRSGGSPCSSLLQRRGRAAQWYLTRRLLDKSFSSHTRHDRRDLYFLLRFYTRRDQGGDQGRDQDVSSHFPSSAPLTWTSTWTVSTTTITRQHARTSTLHSSLRQLDLGRRRQRGKKRKSLQPLSTG